MSLPLPEPIVRTSNVKKYSFLQPRNKKYNNNTSWDSGGVQLADSSKGLLDFHWKAYTNGSTIFLGKSVGSEVSFHPILYANNITEIDLTFDQLSRYVICFVSEGVSKLYWYNTLVSSYVITDFIDAKSPKVSLDDKRAFNVGESDVIFAYINNNNLCYRLQRQRYNIEHILHPVAENSTLKKIGMCTDNRFRFLTNQL